MNISTSLMNGMGISLGNLGLITEYLSKDAENSVGNKNNIQKETDREIEEAGRVKIIPVKPKISKESIVRKFRFNKGGTEVSVNEDTVLYGVTNNIRNDESFDFSFDDTDFEEIINNNLYEEGEECREDDITENNTNEMYTDIWNGEENIEINMMDNSLSGSTNGNELTGNVNEEDDLFIDEDEYSNEEDDLFIDEDEYSNEEDGDINDEDEYNNEEDGDINDEDELFIDKNKYTNGVSETLIDGNGGVHNELGRTTQSEQISNKNEFTNGAEMTRDRDEELGEIDRLKKQIAEMEAKLDRINSQESSKNTSNISEINIKKDTEVENKQSNISANEQYTIYNSMDINTIYKEVKEFMIQHGVSKKAIDLTELNTKFGELSIRKLIQKSYLIKIGKGVTIGR